MAPISTSFPNTETRWQVPEASLFSAGSLMNRSRATRSRVLVSFSCFSNSNQPKRSCAFFIGGLLSKTSATALPKPLFKRGRFPGREDDGKLLDKAFPLADHGCAILLFLGEFRRNLFALPRSDVALFARAKNSVDETRASDQANLARMQRCEWPSSDNGWFRGEDSRGLPVGRRVRNEILQFIQRQALKCQCCRPTRWHGVRVVARVCQLRQALVLASERGEAITALANIAVTKLFALTARPPNAGNEDLAIANRLRIGQAKHPRTFEVGSEDIRAVGRALGRNHQQEYPTGDEPSEDVIQEHCLKSFPSVPCERPVVRGIAKAERERLDSAMGFQTVSLNNLGKRGCGLFRAIGIQFNSVASCAGIPGNGSERRAVSDARIQGRKQLDRKPQEIPDSFRFSERQRVVVAANFGVEAGHAKTPLI